MKASEARKFSQGKETKRILSMIKYVSGFGIKFLSHPGIVDDETKKELEALGYKVSFHRPGFFSSGWDTDCTDISW